MLHADLTDKVLGAFHRVYNDLGHGFLEKVHENSMLIALREDGLLVEQRKSINVYCANQVVGEYFADLMVENRVLVELKSAKAIDPAHEAQLLNYLKATRLQVGLLLNFGPKPDFRRKGMAKPST